MRINNRIVIDISKCTHAWNGWMTTDGNHLRRTKPLLHTVHGHEFDAHAPAFHIEYQMAQMDNGRQPTTLLEVAIARNMLDTWIPYTTFQLSNNHSLTYTGDKAIALWKAWNERIFNKKKRKK